MYYTYLLRSFLMVTPLILRSLHSTPPELILNWSRANLNNFDAGNKLNSDFWSFGSHFFIYLADAPISILTHKFAIFGRINSHTLLIRLRECPPTFSRLMWGRRIHFWPLFEPKRSSLWCFGLSLKDLLARYRVRDSCSARLQENTITPRRQPLWFK